MMDRNEGITRACERTNNIIIYWLLEQNNLMISGGKLGFYSL